MKKQFILLPSLTFFFLSIGNLATAGEAIPTQFRGEWGEKNCRNSGDVQIDEAGAPTIEIKGKSIRVMDMSCELRKTIKSESTIFVGKFSCESEGESSDSLFMLSLSNGRLTYGISDTPDGFGSGSGDLLQRCNSR